MGSERCADAWGVGVFVPILGLPMGRCDPDDDKVIGTALRGGAEVVATGDQGLLAVPRARSSGCRPHGGSWRRRAGAGSARPLERFAMTALSPSGAPLGDPVPGWTPPPRPGPAVMEGRWARLERLDPQRHAPEVHAANSASDAIWDYLPYGPFGSEGAWRAWAEGMAAREDPLFYAVRDLATGRAAGVASFLRIDPANGSIEVGHICLAPALQRRPAATEALFLLMAWAFGAGYRRFEWKCNALNLPSRRAAERLGLSYEGTFRQAAVVKGRNRDTAWFAAVDREWPALRDAFEAWLSPSNFDGAGRQRAALSALTRPVLAARNPALGSGL